MKKIRGQIVYSLEERLIRLSIINEQTGCIEWTGSTYNGYGKLIIGSRTNNTRKSIAAHRLSWIVKRGDIPKKMYVCHHCDNRRCINIEHLFLGTHQDNIDDREKKGRNNPLRGEAKSEAKLNDTIVLSMRRLRSKGLTFNAIAEKFGVNKTTALNAIKGKTWAHVPPTSDKIELTKRNRGNYEKYITDNK